ncbi:bifunctional hydroxymethylpyrimidine kinase/phosphomethylpyrimidine kinase [Deltaproteobacteria bacterium Smac51]|nr:bifunctional hydroxymethylpyrimidine kinase/phosphomethylpyrimidine kinase [Deltaproteobacteria bacterium Smac51]
MTIATSDSGGGAGIEADLKAFAALKVYGACVLSAVTAQNTTAVTAMECLSPSLVTAQLQAVYDDFPVEAIKIGLLGNAGNTLAVADFLALNYREVPIVLDPVMVSTSGHTFLPPEAVEALKGLMKLATLITPNIPEAEVLSGLSIHGPEDQVKAAEAILALGVKNVLVKGGHGSGPTADDLLICSEGPVWIKGRRVDTPNTHGTGCTLSSAIAAGLAKGLNLTEAVRAAKEYVTGGLEHSLNLGHGPGPLNHFHPYYLFKETEQR